MALLPKSERSTIVPACEIPRTFLDRLKIDKAVTAKIDVEAEMARIDGAGPEIDSLDAITRIRGHIEDVLGIDRKDASTRGQERKFEKGKQDHHRQRAKLGG